MTTTGSGHPPDIFPFVVGCGRSGTTLVRAILDSHADLAVPAETKFISTMGALRRRYETPRGIDLDPFLRDLYRYTDLDARWDLPRAVLEAQFRSQPPADYPDAVRRIFAIMAARAGKPRYANKTPKHVLTMGMLARLFPESRFVHVIRDGRDVATSYLDSEFGPGTVGAAALHWRRHVRTGRRIGSEMGSTRYHELLYEDLVADPEPNVRALCSFLELSYDPAMLTYHDRADDILRGIKQPQYHSSLRLPPTPHLRDWRATMAAADVARFEALAGGTLERFGYERCFRRLRPRVVATTRARAVIDESRRGFEAASRRLGHVGRRVARSPR